MLDHELKEIQKVCEQKYREKKFEPPKITIIIVGKRHHTRFYPTNIAHADTKHEGGTLCNPLNGTVVDRGITMHKGWDFYLQAHSAIKGTVRFPYPSAQQRPLIKKTKGKTRSLRSNPQRNGPTTRPNRNNHPQPLLPVRSSHEGGVLLLTDLLRRHHLCTRPCLAHEALQHAWEPSWYEVRFGRQRSPQSEDECSFKVRSFGTFIVPVIFPRDCVCNAD